MDELREAIGQQVLDTMLWSNHPLNGGLLALEITDALLSGPLAPLLAKLSALRHQRDTALRSLDIHREAADRDNAKLRAVAELAKEWEKARDHYEAPIVEAARELRAALAAS